ncbi:hypothetical protein B9Z36_07295 [Limnohabitans sp. Rim8]|nr:hypothetical protein B9Z36_07295 [Limnohabitans sp. Rim8]
MEWIFTKVNVSVEIIHHQSGHGDAHIEQRNFFEVPVFQIAEEIERADCDHKASAKYEITLKSLRV